MDWSFLINEKAFGTYVSFIWWLVGIVAAVILSALITEPIQRNWRKAAEAYAIGRTAKSKKLYLDLVLAGIQVGNEYIGYQAAKMIRIFCYLLLFYTFTLTALSMLLHQTIYTKMFAMKELILVVNSGDEISDEQHLALKKAFSREDVDIYEELQFQKKMQNVMKVITVCASAWFTFVIFRLMFVISPRQTISAQISVLHSKYMHRMLAISTKDEIKNLSLLELRISDESTLREFFAYLQQLAVKYGFPIDPLLFKYTQPAQSG